MLDKIKGALFGFAIGDALGGTTEFLSNEQIRNKYGLLKEIIGGGYWDLEKGETTDDTAMTLAVARGIVKNPHEPIKDIGEEFIKWFNSRPKDVGVIISTVLRKFNGDWFETAEMVHYEELNERTAGNGTLMRCLPIALAYKDLEIIEAITIKQSKMTHYDSIADETCIIYNRIAYHILHGKELKEAIRDEIKGTMYETALSGAKPTCPPSGYVVHTMHWVLYWLLNSDTFSDVVIGATNEGDDSDTIAAIAGGLAGLACGYDQLPKEYTEVLLEREELEEISIRLKETQELL